MSYSSYDRDDLEPASTMRIERRIYFESGKADLSEMVKLPLAELLSLRAESAAAEQEVFDRLKEQAAAWEEQAGRTLFLDKALEYARTLPVTHGFYHICAKRSVTALAAAAEQSAEVIVNAYKSPHFYPPSKKVHIFYQISKKKAIANEKKPKNPFFNCH